MVKHSFSICVPLYAASVVWLAHVGLAYSANETEYEGANYLEVIEISARKISESIDEAPLAIAAFTADAITELKVRDLSNLSVAMPNVALDELGTTRGTANFSIRGLGINSSIPSIDPTVGLFVDGVYIGITSGIVFDMMDLQSIEVVRGPQSALFGRNVTGGAILITTAKPDFTPQFNLETSIEVGGEEPGFYLSGAFEDQIFEDVAGKLSFYKNRDQGWFYNSATQDSHGSANTLIIRPALHWQLSDKSTWDIRYEHMDTDDSGTAAQSHTNALGIPSAWSNFERDSFGFANNNEGYQRTQSDFVTSQFQRDIDLGDGRLSHIFGWRDFSSDAFIDVDATELSLLHTFFEIEATQLSNELKYTGSFDERWQVTTGVSWLSNEIDYHERRLILEHTTDDGTPALTQDGGGLYRVDTLSWYGALDYMLTEQLTVNLGLGYSHEEKQVDIASLVQNVNAPCHVLLGSCEYDFVDNNTWVSFSPKLGFQYQQDDNANWYFHWTRGFRSGGYNLRNSARDTENFGPGPFDQEQADNLELGYKQRFDNGGYLYVAAFNNYIQDMQREINLPDPTAGLVQLIRNTADANIPGLELETGMRLNSEMFAELSLGYLDAQYETVNFDLNGDGLLDSNDEALELPRAAKWTYSFSLSHSREHPDMGHFNSRISYSFRDRSAYTDNNLGFIDAQRIINASIDWHISDNWKLSLYGRNLLNEVKHGGDTQLAALLSGFPLGGTFAPLAKGRIYGIQLRYHSD